MKLIFSILFSLTIYIQGIAQVAPDKYWVSFTDKNNSPYTIDEPEDYLSPKAIERREKYNIPVTVSDLPVNPSYISSVAGTGVDILNVSKWLNSVTIYTTNQNALNTINSFPFVKNVVKCTSSSNFADDKDVISKKEFFDREQFSQGPVQYKSSTVTDGYDYGAAYNQIHMMNGEFLHNMGYDGEGMIIAILDGGFLNADDIPAFDSLWTNGQILGTRDFVDASAGFFDGHPHGTMVLSTMGGNLPGEYTGTAPKASYWLIHTEDTDSEYLIEELNWVSGAEFADSLGADVINSSLGYTEFDDPSSSHTYQDMDGNTAPATIGADFAVSRGMIVVNSAGNSGGSSWQYIGSPADGDSVFSIGAVDDNGNYASFSSTGPTFDGRLKPNVAAQGQGSAICDPWGGVSFGSGTSFSSPIMAGLVACLWQSSPDSRNTDIMLAIEQSGSQYNSPDNLLGYGIPDFEQALNILTTVGSDPAEKPELKVFPNPVNKELNIILNKELRGTNTRLDIIDAAGSVVYTHELKQQITELPLITVEIPDHIVRGFYMIRLSNDYIHFQTRIIRK